MQQQQTRESLKFHALVEQEACVRLQFDWSNVPTNIDWCVYSKVSEWLFEVRCTYELQMETLVLAIHLFNCCLVAKIDPQQDHTQLASVSRSEKMQAWACACLWVASKRIELSPLMAEDLVDVSDGACTPHELMSLELYVLQFNSFQLDVPTAWDFRNVYQANQQAPVSPSYLALADYLLLIAITWSSSATTHHTRFPASTLALASILAAERIVNNNNNNNINNNDDCASSSITDLNRCTAWILDKVTRYEQQSTFSELHRRFQGNNVNPSNKNPPTC
jgi:hypothetical protein